MDFTYPLGDIDSVAAAILEHAVFKIFLFYGDMGVGKTTLIKSLTEQLGSTAHVSSPTFSIVNEYETDSELIYHFDLYRIESEEEALNFGIEDYLFSDHYVFMEWPDKLADLLPENAHKIEIKLNLDGSRTLTMV
ncbi:tRNA (adenosine(37)-N6)-threonylcarbamoyltransferase complex ATPase subunit type 1 TsaE [Gelidibacter sp. F2691]|nr:tRNA (adenosine(37)-N6)-threonylcarbamoyltransferase complex ATPase subunit type 1 TsaE [Gelidibacter sp. F2691]